jgi:hypothetical protein
MSDQADSSEAGGVRRSRRLLLAGAAGGLGVIAAQTISRAAPAEATQGSAVIEGQDNTGATARTLVSATTGETALLADPGTGVGVAGVGTGGFSGVSGTGGPGGPNPGQGGGAGVEGFGSAKNGPGVVGTGASTGGFGVIGVGTGGFSGVDGRGGSSNGPGVTGEGGGSGDGVVGSATTGNGVHGTASAAAGVGVLAANTAGGIALKATGPAVFSRSGLLTVAAGQSSATQTGVALTSASLVLATLQQNLSGVSVRSAVPNVPGSSFTVHLSKAPSTSAAVAWFVVN